MDHRDYKAGRKENKLQRKDIRSKDRSYCIRIRNNPFAFLLTGEKEFFYRFMV